MESTTKSNICWFWLFFVVVLVVILDQVSKYLVLKFIQPYQIIAVVENFFNLTLTFNKGVAFGLLSSFPDTLRISILVVTTTIALGLVVFFLLKEYNSHFGPQVALAMIMGGAFGNIIDRLRIGMVVDFIDLYISNYHWPAFNVADSAICLGVVYLLFFAPTNVKMDSELSIQDES